MNPTTKESKPLDVYYVEEIVNGQNFYGGQFLARDQKDAEKYASEHYSPIRGGELKVRKANANPFSKPTSRRGFSVRCILCGHPEVLMSLADVSHFHCAECDEDFTTVDVAAWIDGWTSVLAWCSSAPAIGR